MALLMQKRIDDYLHFAEIGEDADKVSYEKIRKVGFETTISLKEGLTELIKGCRWFRHKSVFQYVR
jgi:hypothetical protein